MIVSLPMTVNVEVESNNNENSVSLVRRFSRRVLEAGILPRVKGTRYKQRPVSKLSKKKRALKVIAKRAMYEKLAKLGKSVPRSKKRRRR